MIEVHYGGGATKAEKYAKNIEIFLQIIRTLLRLLSADGLDQFREWLRRGLLNQSLSYASLIRSSFDCYFEILRFQNNLDPVLIFSVHLLRFD